MKVLAVRKPKERWLNSLILFVHPFQRPVGDAQSSPSQNAVEMSTQHLDRNFHYGPPARPTTYHLSGPNATALTGDDRRCFTLGQAVHSRIMIWQSGG